MAVKKLSRKSIANYWMYSWWKYLALVVVCVMGVDVLFTTTAYRVPEDKKVEVFILNGYVDADRLYNDLWPALLAFDAEQEEMLIQNINISSSDVYAYMQFSTYVAAQQGDVCLMPTSEVKKLVTDGAEYSFLELTPYIESGVIDPRDIDLSAGRFRSSEGIEGLYAIPADSLYGLFELSNNPADSMLCILDYNGNDEASAAVLGQMIEFYHGEKPEIHEEQTDTVQAPLF